MSKDPKTNGQIIVKISGFIPYEDNPDKGTVVEAQALVFDCLNTSNLPSGFLKKVKSLSAEICKVIYESPPLTSTEKPKEAPTIDEKKFKAPALELCKINDKTGEFIVEREIPLIDPLELQ
jgi:hypothetical protein